MKEKKTKAGRGVTIGDYRIKKKIGSGASSKVYLAEHIETKVLRAMKKIKIDFIVKNTEQKEKFKTEIYIMSQIRHPNIVHCFEFYESNNHYYIIMEYCEGGSLERLRNLPGGISEEQAMTYMTEIREAFRKLREKMIIHRDIKLENLLIRDGKLKISDFGVAMRGKELTNTKMVGTPLIMAPEIMRAFEEEDTMYSAKVDLWSIGVVLYEMLFGKTPFSGDYMGQMMYKAKHNSGENLEILKPISPTMENFLKGLLTFEPEKRISWKDYFDHPVFKKFSENIKVKKSLVKRDNTLSLPKKKRVKAKSQVRARDNFFSKKEKILPLKRRKTREGRLNSLNDNHLNSLTRVRNYSGYEKFNRSTHLDEEKRKKIHEQIMQIQNRQFGSETPKKFDLESSLRMKVKSRVRLNSGQRNKNKIKDSGSGTDSALSGSKNSRFSQMGQKNRVSRFYNDSQGNADGSQLSNTLGPSKLIFRKDLDNSRELSAMSKEFLSKSPNKKIGKFYATSRSPQSNSKIGLESTKIIMEESRFTQKKMKNDSQHISAFQKYIRSKSKNAESMINRPGPLDVSPEISQKNKNLSRRRVPHLEPQVIEEKNDRRKLTERVSKRKKLYTSRREFGNNGKFRRRKSNIGSFQRSFSINKNNQRKGSEPLLYSKNNEPKVTSLEIPELDTSNLKNFVDKNARDSSVKRSALLSKETSGRRLDVSPLSQIHRDWKKKTPSYMRTSKFNDSGKSKNRSATRINKKNDSQNKSIIESEKLVEFRYIHEMNKIIFLHFTIQKTREIIKRGISLESELSVYLIAIYLTKKAQFLNEEILESLKNHENYFSMSGFQEFTQNSKYLNTIKNFEKDRPNFKKYQKYLVDWIRGRNLACISQLNPHLQKLFGYPQQNITLNEINMVLTQNWGILNSLSPDIVLSSGNDSIENNSRVKASSISKENGFLFHSTVKQKHDYWLFLLQVKYATFCKAFLPFQTVNGTFDWKALFIKFKKMSLAELKNAVRQG